MSKKLKQPKMVMNVILKTSFESDEWMENTAYVHLMADSDTLFKMHEMIQTSREFLKSLTVLGAYFSHVEVSLPAGMELFGDNDSCDIELEVFPSNEAIKHVVVADDWERPEGCLTARMELHTLMIYDDMLYVKATAKHDTGYVEAELPEALILPKYSFNESKI